MKPTYIECFGDNEYLSLLTKSLTTLYRTLIEEKQSKGKTEFRGWQPGEEPRRRPTLVHTGWFPGGNRQAVNTAVKV